MKKRFWAFFLSVALIMSLLPTTALAAGTYTVPDEAEVLAIVPLDSTNDQTIATYLWLYEGYVYAALEAQKSQTPTLKISDKPYDLFDSDQDYDCLSIPGIGDFDVGKSNHEWLIYRQKTTIDVNTTVLIITTDVGGGHTLNGSFYIAVPEPAILLDKCVAMVNDKNYENGLVYPEDIITYEITVTNIGNVALSKIVLKDTVDTEPVANIQNIQVNKDLAPGESVTVEYTYTVPDDAEPGSIITNVVALESATPEEGDTVECEGDEVTVEVGVDTYKVIYSVSGDVPEEADELPADAEYSVGSTVEVADEPDAVAGYTFEGWETQDAEIVNGQFVMPGKDVTITGTWTQDKYIVTYDANGGAFADDVISSFDNKLYGEDMPKATEDPTREGYEFLGWGVSANAEEPVTIPETVTGNATYYAIWNEIYTVTYDLNGGTGEFETQSKPHGVEIRLNEFKPERTGYTFVNWLGDDRETYEPADFYATDADLKLTAQWAPADNQYVIEYYFENIAGTSFVKDDTETETIADGVKTDDPVSVDPETKTFTGFTYDSNNDENVTSATVAADGSTVLKLYYTRNSYTVTYQYDKTAPAAAPALPDETAYEFGAKVTIADDPTLEGYEFLGWKPESSLKNSETGTFVMPAAPVVFVGSWAAKPAVFEPQFAVYKVEHYKEQEDGQYTLAETEFPLPGKIGEKVTATPKAYDNYKVNYENSEMTGAVKMPSEKDPTYLILKVYYDMLEPAKAVVEKNVYQLLDTEGKQFWPVELDGDVDLPNDTDPLPRIAFEPAALPAVKAGETIIWEITVENVGDQAGEFMLNELLAGVQVFADEACTVPVDLTQPISIGAPGDNEVPGYLHFFAKYTVQEKDVAEIINKIKISGNEEPIVAPGVDVANIAVTKTADKKTVYVGETITYTITVTNEGTVPLWEIIVEDSFDLSKVKFVENEAVVLYDDYFLLNETLEPDDSVTFSYQYTPTATGELLNQVNATGGYDNGSNDNYVSEATTEKVVVDREYSRPRPTRPALNKEDHYAYIVGYPDGLVHPERNITRAEVSTIFFRMLLDESREDFWAQENWFSDVPADQWYNNAVSTLSNAGLITGYPDGSFKPNANITRAEFATIAIRFFLEEDVEITENNLTDIKGHWAEANINLAYALNLINGYPDNTFRPDQKITRAEAMTIVNRVLERAPHKDHLLDDMIEWPDNMDTDAWYYADVQEATNSHEFYKTEIKGEDEEYEIWTELLPVRDWAALERMWSEANSSKNPGEVVDINISTPEASN